MQLLRNIGKLGRAFWALVLLSVLTLQSILIGRIAVAWWIAQAGGAAHMATYAVIGSAASVLFLPALSPLADRKPKRHVISWALAALAIESAATAALAQWGSYSLTAIVVLSLFGVASTSLFMPILFTMAAEILAPQQLTQGLSIQSSAQAIGRLIGPVIAGLLLTQGGVVILLWGQVALIAVSLLALFGLRAHGNGVPSSGTRSTWVSDLRAGLRMKWAVPLERGWTFVSFFGMMIVLPGIGLLVPLKLTSLGTNGSWLAAAEGGLSLGFLAASVGGAMWLSRILGRSRVTLLAVAVQSLGMIVTGLTHSPLAVAIGLTVIGFGVVTLQLIGQTHRMLAVPVRFRGRFIAAGLAVTEVATILGSSGASLVVSGVGVDQAYVFFGLALVGAIAAYNLIPGFRDFLTLSPEEAEGHHERTHPHLFGTGVRGPTKP